MIRTDGFRPVERVGTDRTLLVLPGRGSRSLAEEKLSRAVTDHLG